MKNKANEIKTKICIPKGFFGGNCSDCIYWEEYNRNSDGRAYCSYYDDWYYPSERRNCFVHGRFGNFIQDYLYFMSISY